MRFDNLVFDLDGTLIHSIPGIEASLQRALFLSGLPFEVPDLTKVVGPPLRKMLGQMWPQISSEESERVLAHFRAHYDTEGCLHSQLFPGVQKTLNRFRSAGLRLFVLTNKPLAPSRRILRHFEVETLFDDIFSPDVCQPVSTSKPQLARTLQETYGLRSDRTLIAGDSHDDEIAAQQCGFSFARADYGYGRHTCASSEPLARLAKFEDLERLALAN